MTGLWEDACCLHELLCPYSAYVHSFGICALHIFSPIMLVTHTQIRKIKLVLYHFVLKIQNFLFQVIFLIF